MPPLTITKTYVNGNVPFASDIDNIVTPITTLLNTTLLDNLNVQTGGLIGANLASSAISNFNLGPQSVGTSQLASSAVTTTVIGPLSVAIPQLAAYNSSASDGCGVFASSGANVVAVTNLSVTMNFSGLRPVFMMLFPQSTTVGTSNCFCDRGASFRNFAWVKNGNTMAAFTRHGLTDKAVFDPMFWVDTSPSQGSNTYSFKLGASTANVGSSAYLISARMFVWEPG